MIIHVRDERVDTLARELADIRGISITDAIREALQSALASESEKPSLWERTQDIRHRIAAYPRTGLEADKAFFDSVSGQEED